MKPRPPFDAARLEVLFGPLRHHARIGLAVSGGPDSLALMMLYSAWRTEGPTPEAIVYSVDHGLRPESADEADFVVTLAARYGLAARSLRWEGPYPDTGIQAAARVARYRLIGNAMAEDGASVLATGHQRDDQAETVLMRLAHGSGASGLAGMRGDAIVEGVNVLRPLLDCGRNELAALVAAEGVTAIADPSNANPAFERVRWRQALADLAPFGLTAERLSTFAVRMARIDRLAEAETMRFLDSNVVVDGFGVCTIDRAAFSDAPAEVAMRALMACVGFAGAGQKEKLAAVEALTEAVRAGGDVRETLMGAQIVAEDRRCLVFREVRRMSEPAVSLAPDAPVVFDKRFRVEARRAGFTLHPGEALSRETVETWLGIAVNLPMAAVRAAPVVRDAEDHILALGTYVRDEALTVALAATPFARTR